MREGGEMYTLGVIGTGNMGRALVGGVLRKKILGPSEILCFDRAKEALEGVVGEWGVHGASNGREVADKCHVVVLAVKPQNLEEVAGELEDSTGGRLIVSILAGKRVSEIRSTLGEDVKIVRAMPNTPCLIGKGVTGLYASGDVSDEERRFVLDLFRSLGVAEYFEKEEMLDVITGFTGSGPAFVFVMIEALADGAVRCGLPRDVALPFATALVEGSAALLSATKTHPARAKEMVMSPGGTTAEGIAVLEERSFRATIIEAVKAAYEKCRKL